MPMPMMNIRQVGVAVLQGRMAVRVNMRAITGLFTMDVPVMLVMDMLMNMLQHFVAMLMGMPLGEHQPACHRHQRNRDEQHDRQRLSQKQHRQPGTDERRRAEVRRGTGAAQVAQRQHIQHQADAIARRAQSECGDNRPP